jgi:3,2-trans-enoyl-CoA isomerase
MTDTGSIGLNEVALGIAVPKFWGELMARVVGRGRADRLLQFAMMLEPEEAKDDGLVDEVVPRYKLASTAEAAMQQMLKVPDHSRAVSGGKGGLWGGLNVRTFKWAVAPYSCCTQ